MMFGLPAFAQTMLNAQMQMGNGRGPMPTMQGSAFSPQAPQQIQQASQPAQPMQNVAPQPNVPRPMQAQQPVMGMQQPPGPMPTMQQQAQQPRPMNNMTFADMIQSPSAAQFAKLNGTMMLPGMKGYAPQNMAQSSQAVGQQIASAQPPQPPQQPQVPQAGQDLRSSMNTWGAMSPQAMGQMSLQQLQQMPQLAYQRLSAAQKAAIDPNAMAALNMRFGQRSGAFVPGGYTIDPNTGAPVKRPDSPGQHSWDYSAYESDGSGQNSGPTAAGSAYQEAGGMNQQNRMGLDAAAKAAAANGKLLSDAQIRQAILDYSRGGKSFNPNYQVT